MTRTPPSHPALPCRQGLRRRHWLTAAALAGLAGCGSLVGPQVITLNQADLDRLLGRSFPMQRRLLDWVDIALSAPRVQLLPERNRMAVQLDLAGSAGRIAGWGGRARLDFDSALRYEPRDATVRLTQVRVQQLVLDGAGAALPPAAPASPATPAGPLARLGQALVASALEDLALYTVPAERLAELRRLGLAPGAVTITARGVEITLASAA